MLALVFVWNERSLASKYCAGTFQWRSRGGVCTVVRATGSDYYTWYGRVLMREISVVNVDIPIVTTGIQTLGIRDTDRDHYQTGHGRELYS